HFRFLDYKVYTVGSAEAALEVLETKKVDIIISDIMMPGIDGIELLRTVHREYPMIHVIMMTGYVNQENVLACMRHGADTCIYKPIEELEELEHAVKNAVDSIENWKHKMATLLKMKPKHEGSRRE
ncbi:MAG: response regulator, partial [Spartobacteria bacterium]|nr:response regulator [Spartobacteria bacterium]